MHPESAAGLHFALHHPDKFLAFFGSDGDTLHWRPSLWWLDGCGVFTMPQGTVACSIILCTYLAASMGPTPKISVRVVAEASTSDSMRSFRSTIFRFSVRILGAGAPKLVGGGRARRSPALVCRAGCARPDRPRAFRLSRRARGLVEAHAGG